VMGKGKILIDAPIREVYHQKDLLESTYLSPPQSVILAQSIMSKLFPDQSRDQQRLLPIKPQEVADLLSFNS